VQTSVGDPLARALIAGEIRDGQVVMVDELPDASGLTVTAR
jgi:hypothetical protein